MTFPDIAAKPALTAESREGFLLQQTKEIWLTGYLWNIKNSSLQCYSVLSDIWVKIELRIPLESESSVLSTCYAFVCLSPPSKLKFAVLFCSIYKGLISFSAILF